MDNINFEGFLKDEGFDQYYKVIFSTVSRICRIYPDKTWNEIYPQVKLAYLKLIKEALEK